METGSKALRHLLQVTHLVRSSAALQIQVVSSQSQPSWSSLDWTCDIGQGGGKKQEERLRKVGDGKRSKIKRERTGKAADAPARNVCMRNDSITLYYKGPEWASQNPSSLHQRECYGPERVRNLPKMKLCVFWEKKGRQNKTYRASKMEIVHIFVLLYKGKTKARRDGMTCPGLKYVRFKEDKGKETGKKK